MMKKIMIALVMITMLFGVVGVIADTQIIGGDVPSHIEFSLSTTDVDYGEVSPGSQSIVKANQIDVSENNNVDFTIDITLTSDPNTLFENLFFDLDDSTTYEDIEQLDEVLVWSITNQEGPFIDTVNSILDVPPGFLPVTDASGTITYLITAPGP